MSFLFLVNCPFNTDEMFQCYFFDFDCTMLAVPPYKAALTQSVYMKMIPGYKNPFGIVMGGVTLLSNREHQLEDYSTILIAHFIIYIQV